MALNSFLKKSLVIFSLAFGVFASIGFSQNTGKAINPIDTLSKYEAYSQFYYENQSRLLSNELIPLERYLTFLLEGINRQVKRQKDIQPVELASLSSEEISKLALAISLSDKRNYYTRKYETWKNYQYNELFLKMDKALRIKKRIFDKSSPEAKRDMFNFDAGIAIEKYEYENYPLAKMFFEHIYNFYNYKNMDDILNQINEINYIKKNYLTAEEGYQRLIKEYPQSEYYQKSIFRLITLYYKRGEYDNVHKTYRVFKQRYDTLAKQKNEAGEIIGWQFKPDLIFFMEGSAYFKESFFDKAIEVFNLVDENSLYYCRAKYLTGHCCIKLQQDDLSVEYFDKILYGEIPTDDIALWSEAAIIAGDICMNKGDINQAWGYYSVVQPNSSIYPRALIGRGMVRFLRGEYDMADKLMNEIIDFNYSNNYIYIARCLKGSALRELDSLGQATTQYQIILNESGKKIKLVNYLTERLKLTYLVNEWEKGEGKVMETGDEELLERYWYLRTNAENLLKREYYSEIIEVDPKFKEYIDEKLSLLQLIDEYYALGEDVVRLNNATTRNKYNRMQSELIDIGDMVRASGYGRLQNLPYYYRNINSQFNAGTVDSLYNATSRELSRLEDDLIYLSKALTTVANDIDPQQRGSMLQTAYNVRQWRTQLDNRISTNIMNVKQFPELDITRWSHVAFHKTMIPGDDFNDLKAEQKRVKEIDTFLEKMDAITLQFGISLTD